MDDMLNLRKSLAVVLAGLVAPIALAGCSGDDTEPGQPTDNVTDMADNDSPPGADEGGADEGFTGEISVETITANNMQIEIPTGMRIPEDALVTQADHTSIMIADADEGPVVDMVKQSADEAGYEVYAEGQHGTVFVGHGNAVLLSAGPNMQLLTWGPEAMKDVLAN